MGDRFVEAFWFLNVFGCAEDPSGMAELFEVEDEGECVVLTSKANGRRFRTGKLELRCLSSFKPAKSERKGRFSIVHANGARQWADIVCAVNYPEFDGATFQVLTGVNCLALPETLIEDKSQEVVTNYVYDEDDSAAQVSVATGPSSVYRVYFDDKKNVNMIEGVPFDIEDGMACVDDSVDEAALRALKCDWENLDHYRVGVQTRCPVVVEKDGQWMALAEKGQEVHLVFCSALSYLNFPMCPTARKISQAMAEAQYKATILAACENARRFPGKPGSNMLFLRLLGIGELYDNPISWMTGAIASCKSLIEESGLEVFLVCEDCTTFEKACADLRPMTEELDGTVIEMTKDEDELQNEECCCQKRPVYFALLALVGLVIVLATAAFLKTSVKSQV